MNISKKIVLSSLFCVCGLFHAYAQMIRTVGRIVPHNPSAYSTIIVSDAAGDEPLGGATVKIVHKRDTLITTTRLVDLGPVKIAFCFYEKTPQDSVELNVSYVGYKSFFRKYSAAEFKGTQRIQLFDDVTAISQIVVVGEQVAMVIRGDTTFYNAASFKTLEGDRFRELLRQLPGVEVKDNRIYANGEEIKRVYVDGRNFFGDNPEYVLSDLTADDVRSVKVYDQQSPDAKYLGDDKARNEKVMDVVTYSKPDVIKGGVMAAQVGVSLGKEGYSGEKFRYDMGTDLYRNTERNNLRLGLIFQENSPSNATVASQGITPGSRQDVSAGHSLRRGDSLMVSTNFIFRRNTRESRSLSNMVYFPDRDYSQRSQNTSSFTEGRSHTFSLSENIQCRRRGNIFMVSARGELNRAKNASQNFTLQQIDDEQTVLDRNIRGDGSGGSVNLHVTNSTKIGTRAFLFADANFKYSRSSEDGLNVDTVASNSLMRTIIDNNTDANNIQVNASAIFKFDLSKMVALGLAYRFGYNYGKSRRASMDYIADPVGSLDFVNSYNYTINSYRNIIDPQLTIVKNDFHFDLGFGFQAYSIISDERLPIAGTARRHYYSFVPSLNLLYMTSAHNLLFSMNSSAEELSLEQIRSGLDVTNPLVIRAGNPDLRQTKQYAASIRYNYTDAAHSATWSFGVSGNFKVDYMANKSTLFTVQTYLPKYDYTMQSGAQLNEIVNADGYYGWQVGAGYSKRLKFGLTIKTEAKYLFDRMPYFVGSDLSYARNNAARLSLSAISGFSNKVRFEFDSTSELSYYDTKNQQSKHFSQDLRGMVQAMILKYNILTVSTAYHLYRNYAVSNVNRDDILTNAAIGRKFGKERKLELSVGVVDLFNRINNARTLFTDNYISTTTSVYLGRYGYIRATYQF